MEYSTIIRKKNNGYQYVITYKLNGVWKQKSKQGFTKKGEAQIAMDKMIPQLEKIVKNNVINDKITFKVFYEMYIKRVNLYREENTMLRYSNAQKAFNKLDNIELIKITNNDIQLCIDDMTNNCLKASTVKVYTSTLKTMFKSAKDDYNLLIDIPSFNLEIKEDKNIINKKALNKVEVEKLLDNVKKAPYYLAFLLAIKTGMRKGEILGLTWDNIDLENKKIHVLKQWKKLNNGKHGLGDLKSKNSNRIIPIPDSLCDELQKNRYKTYDDNRVFKYKYTLAKELSRNLKPFGITFHELRHTYATNLIANGVDFKTVAYLMGHDIKETMATYSHVTDDMISNVTNIIDKIL